MRNNMKNIILILLSIVVLISIAVGCSKTTSDTVEEPTNTQTNTPVFAEIGKAAPLFELEDMSGKIVNLSDYKGKYVVINFWTTWCKFCKIEMPDFNNYAGKNKEVVFLAISSGENKGTVEKFIKKTGYKNLKVLLDFNREVTRSYLVRGLPTSFFIDKNGVIRNIEDGMISGQKLSLDMKNLMKK